MLVPIGCWHTLPLWEKAYVRNLGRVAPATTGGIWSSELSEDALLLKVATYIFRVNKKVFIKPKLFVMRTAAKLLQLG